MRIQLLRERVRHVHAIAFTHAHADHLFGLDDARLFPRWIGGPVPVYCEQETEESIRRVFSYAFRPGTEQWPPGFVPKLQFVPDRARRRRSRSWARRVLPIRLEHGPFPVLGFRVGALAYCTDVSRIPEASWPLLEGLDVLILDALRHEPHPTHFSLSEALAVIETLEAAADVLDASVAQLRSWADAGDPAAAGRAGLRWASTGILSGIRVGSSWISSRAFCSQEFGTRCLPTRSSSSA